MIGAAGPQMTKSLDNSVSLQEIQDAVAKMGPWKAPGPDGIPVGVYKENWASIGPSISHLILQMLQDGAYKNGKGAVGGVLMLGNNTQLSWCKYFGTYSSMEYAEITTILESILKTTQMNMYMVKLTTNSLKIFNSLNSKSEMRTDWWLMLSIGIKDFHNIYIYFDHVIRKHNRLVHKLVKISFCFKLIC